MCYVLYLALWGDNLKKAVEDMLCICSDPRAHFDLDLILTQDSWSRQSHSPLDSIMMMFHSASILFFSPFS